MSDEALRRELAYYQRNLDELAAARIATEHRQWALGARLRQKNQGFLLLARLMQSLGGQADLAAMFRILALEINAVLGMDRTVILVPDERGYRPAHFAGVPEARAQELARLRFELPEDALLVRRDSPDTGPVARLRACFGLVTFLCLPVMGRDAPLGIILSGREREDASFCPPLDDGDADTFRAIAGALAAIVDNSRLTLREQGHRWKEEFFTNLSHELRTPLTLTVGPLAQVLEGRWGDLPEAARERLEVVERNQARLLALVNQILDLARLEAGAAQLVRAAIVDTNQLVRECAGHFRAIAELRGLALELVLDPALEEVTLHADRARLERVVFNLLSNAIKFTDAGRVEVRTRREGERFELVVSDTGIGLAPEEQAVIFTRFARVARAAAERPPGSGIGLAVVREIAELHGGSVAVESTPGRGSRFVVSVPLAAPATPVLLPASETAAPPIAAPCDERAGEEHFDPARPIVLCVEDDPELRGYLRDLLGDEHNVCLAADGAEGLDKARRYLPDVVVADQMMPGLSGRELLAALRADPDLAAIPVAFLTARLELAGRVESLAAGADDYITKPFAPDELRARVRNLVRARARERELAEANRRLELRVREQMAELVHTGELRRFLPRAVLETLTRGALDPGRSIDQRRVTVLIADVVGLAASGERLEPHVLSALLDEYLGAVAAIAAARGGTIDSLAGGRVSILFGAPEPCSEEAASWAAVQAGFEIRARLVELAAAARRRGVGNDWRCRIGIASGTCLTGALGGESLRAYTAIGGAAQAAAALERGAASGTIACTAATFALVEERVRAEPAGDDYRLIELRAPRAERLAEPTRTVRRDPPAPGRVFRREGDYWTIAYGGALFRLRDAKGLEYLARLLAEPGRELHVLDLVAPARPLASGRQDAGAVLDGLAKVAYRNRLRELDEELAQARAMADSARVQRLEHELEVLARQLSAAVGMGGRDRRAASVSERARVNVARAIKASIVKITSSSSPLARHLRASVQTGTLCSYRPHPGVPDSWDVSVP